MRRWLFSAAFICLLQACERSPAPTYNVDTTLGDDGEHNASVASNEVASESLRSSLTTDAAEARRSVIPRDSDDDTDEANEPPSEPDLALARSSGSRAAGLRGDPGRFFGPDAYPPGALSMQAQGRVVARLTVSTDGRVTSCDVTSSSGNEDLDATTCNIAINRVRFSPALNDAGDPIEATYTLPVRWVLPSD